MYGRECRQIVDGRWGSDQCAPNINRCNIGPKKWHDTDKVLDLVGQFQKLNSIFQNMLLFTMGNLKGTSAWQTRLLGIFFHGESEVFPPMSCRKSCQVICGHGFDGLRSLSQLTVHSINLPRFSRILDKRMITLGDLFNSVGRPNSRQLHPRPVLS